MNHIPLYGASSACHKSPSLIVRSRAGGFVTQNCVTCGIPRSLPFDDLPILSCESCKRSLVSFTKPAPNHNYAYRCDGCGQGFELHERVPHWNERFEYHGFPLDSDYASDYGIRFAPGSVVYVKLGSAVKIIKNASAHR